MFHRQENHVFKQIVGNRFVVWGAVKDLINVI